MHDNSLQRRTGRHYDTHPFDAITAEGELQPETIQPKPFLQFCDQYLKPGMSVAEVGCGPGRATMYLASRGHQITAIDISSTSLSRARSRVPMARFVQATAMALPFQNAAFDAIVSDGVFHHTEDAYAAFAESARALRNGGFIYVGVYNRRRLYYYLYTYAGPTVRWLERSTVGPALLTMTLIPLYYLIHLAKSCGKRTWTGARNFFYDYIITPQATFHRREEVVAWGTALGLELVQYDPSLGNVHVFIFRKSLSVDERVPRRGNFTDGGALPARFDE